MEQRGSNPSPDAPRLSHVRVTIDDRTSPPLPPPPPQQINDFLEQHINKLRYDRFEQAVQQSFEAVKPNHESWIGAKEEAGSFLRQWYRTTHGVNSFSNAEVWGRGGAGGGGGR